MKLYYLPGACSSATHIMLRETGQNFELEAVSMETGKTETGKDFALVNPKGQVPALELESGEVLTEGAAILQFVADSAPDTAYSPTLGSVERARLQEHLNWIASELHKAFTPLFKAESKAAIEAAKKVVGQKFSYVESILEDGRDFLVGGTFSAADAYLLVVANWANFKEIDLAPWPRLQSYVARMLSRASVVAAYKAEGLA